MTRPYSLLGRTTLLSRYLAAWLFSLVLPALCCVGIPFVGPKRIWLWFARFWACTTLHILGIVPRLSGAPLLGPAVYVANHQSLLDVILLPALLPPGTRFVARRNLRHIPFWGWIFILGGAIPIERKAPRAGDLERLKRGLSALPRGWSVMVFPEGTRGRGSKPAPFKRGAMVCAAQLGLPVIPLGIAPLDTVSPAGSSMLYPGEVYVHVGDAMHPASLEPAALHAATLKAYDQVVDCIAQAERRQSNAPLPVASTTRMPRHAFAQQRRAGDVQPKQSTG